MNHLDDGTLQAFLDDELGADQRAGVAEHLLVCDACREAKEELSRANAVFSEQVAILDVTPPSAVRTPDGGRSRLPGGAFVRAAVLTLLVAAAASAAVPGSPVREWIVRTVEPEPVEVAPTLEAVSPESAAPTPAPAPAGVAQVPTGPVEITFIGLEGTAIRLVETDGRRVAVSAVGGQVDPSFRTGPGTIEVRGGQGGEVTVELPRSVASARVVVDGGVYASKDAGELRIRVRADTVDGGWLWR